MAVATCWNVLSDPEQVLAFNDGNIECVLSPTLHYPEALIRIWDNQFFFGAGSKQYMLSVTALGESVGPVFWRRTAQPILLALCGLAIFWALRQYRIGRPAAAVTAAILVNTGWATTFAFTGLAVRPLALTFTFLALGFVERGRVTGRWLPYAIGGACLGLGISEVPDVGALLAIASSFIFWWMHMTESDGRSRRSEASDIGLGVAGRQSPGSRFWPAVPRFALYVVFSVLLAWQTLDLTFTTTVQGVTQGTEETPAARFAWATQWSIPPAELWNTVSGSYFGTTMRSDTTPYWGRMGKSEGWEKTKQGFRNFSLTGWHLGVIPCILLLALPLWMILTRKMALSLNQQKSGVAPAANNAGSEPQQANDGRISSAAKVPLPPSRAFAWMVCVGCVLALMLVVGKYFVVYRLLWLLPYFDTIRNPDKWNGPFLLGAGLGIAFMLDGLWQSLDAVRHASGKTASRPSRNVRNSQSRIESLIAPWKAIAGTSIGIAALGLAIALWTQADKDTFLAARTSEGYGTAAEIMWRNAVAASFKVAVLAALFGSMALWLASRLRHGRPSPPWMFLGLVAILGLGDLMATNRNYSMPHKYRQYLTPNPLTDYLDAHRTEGRLKLLPPQHPLLNNLRLSLLQIKGYDLFEPISVSRMPTDYAALFKALEANPVRLWELGAVRYFLSLPGTAQQLNQMDGNRGRFVERLTMGVGVVNESYVPIAGAPPDQQYLRLVEFTGALPIYRLVSKVTCLPKTAAGDEEALRSLSLPSFDIARDAVIQSDKPIELPLATNEPAITILRHEAVESDIKVAMNSPGLLVRSVKYDPDWQVKVDDRSATLLKTDYLFQGVVVPAGQHTVTFAYDPSLSDLYFALAARSLLLAIIGAWLLQSCRHAPCHNTNTP